MSQRRLLGIVLGLSVLRLAVAPAFELFPQEAYYDLYGRHPALSYFDHPPLIGWILWAVTQLFGNHAWVLRVCAFALTALTQIVLWQLVRRAIPRERQSAALLLLVTPLMSVVSLVSTPDVPLLLFSTLGLLCFWEAFEGPATRRAGAWIAAGLATGLAFDSKYSGAYLGLGALLLVLDPLHRRQLREPWPYFSGLVAAAATAPVWIWNAQHGFASLRFQTLGRVQGAAGFQLRFLGGLLSSQTVLLGVLFLVFLWEGVRLVWRLQKIAPERRAAILFFAAFSVPPVLFVLGVSLFAQVKPNWLYPFYLAGIPLIALIRERPERLIRPTLGWSLLVQALALIELTLAPFPIRSDDTCFGWRALAATAMRHEPPGGFVFSADGYKTSAELEFYSGTKVYAGNVIGRPGLQYDYFGDDLSSLRGEDALFVDSDPALFDEEPTPSAPPDLVSHFASLRQLEPLVIRQHGRPVRKFWLWYCRDYLGPR